MGLALVAASGSVTALPNLIGKMQDQHTSVTGLIKRPLQTAEPPAAKALVETIALRLETKARSTKRRFLTAGRSLWKVPLSFLAFDSHGAVASSLRCESPHEREWLFVQGF